jgi:ABC-2 type transport system ATP-binding protein
MCVLMSTHTLEAAEEISDRVGIMSHGRLVYDGTISELRQRFGAQDPSLEAMFLSITAQSGGPRQQHDPAKPAAIDSHATTNGTQVTP